MLSKEVLEEQAAVELPAREMMSLQFGNLGFGAVVIQQNNNSSQFGAVNVSEQANGIELGF